MTPIVLLIGPTASGKTAAAIELVKHFPMEIVSVDSAMIYRGMDIGTATPTNEELKQAPHRLINIKDPAESYSVGAFIEDAKREVADIEQQGKMPLLVGGTMMYVNALLKGLSDLPEADEVVRESITQRAEKVGWSQLHEQLAQIDPISAAKIKPNDSQRIQRALEVYEISGQPMSHFWGKQQPVFSNPIIPIAIASEDRAVLHQRIAKRWYQMIDAGLIDEVRQLYQRGDLNVEMPSMRCVGYRQVWEYLAGELSRAALDEKAIVATRRLVKRQMTWLRSFDHFMNVKSDDLLETLKRLC